MIQKERIQCLNDKSQGKGDYVLYWMQASQRVEYNFALKYATLKANHLNKPVVVFFGITSNFPEANERHYTFMLEGLREVKSDLEKRKIQLVIKNVSPELGVINLSKNASLIVVDRDYLSITRKWRNIVSSKIEKPLFQVEDNVIVPIEETSLKEEYSAATIRRKMNRKIDNFLTVFEDYFPHKSSLQMDFNSIDIDDKEKTISDLKIDQSVQKVPYFYGGTSEAKKRLIFFLKEKMDKYPHRRNDPTKDFTSNLSPYLHFGQISPLYIALQVLKTNSPGKEAFLEELIIRRELAMNFVYYNAFYDSYDDCLPSWALNSLSNHEKDRREYTYSLNELEKSETHDPYWNAAQEEMKITGKMHGYMRMYWGKKILEWMEKPKDAFNAALCLNNKYELDGRDPNGFTGVAWCFGKHDRAWKERKIFGKIRYMNSKGLRRKFNADNYVKKINNLL